MTKNFDRRFSVCLVLLVLSLVSNQPAQGETGPWVPGPVKPEALKAAADNNAFALDLYSRLAGQSAGNLILSPFSVSNAMALADAGARGETEREIARVMHFESGQDALHPAFRDLMNDLNCRAGKNYELTMANRLWVQSGYSLLPDYQKLVLQNYGAALQALDFKGLPADAAKAINSWADEQTRGKIPRMVAAEDFNSQTRLVLANAVYFNGKWELPFNPNNTYDKSFWLAPGKKVEVPTMNQEQFFLKAKIPGLSILEMPYRGQDLVMDILLPEKIDGLKGLEAWLNAKSLAKDLDSLKKSKLKVHLPRFKLESDLDLQGALKKMGVKGAFDSGAADFSGMASDKGLFLSEVRHQAIIEVDEYGTEAAALTGLATADGDHEEFSADHPFLFLIRDKRTGSFLFMGRVMDPRPMAH